MENSDKIAAVHKYIEAFDKADMDIIRDIYAEDARVEDPVGTDAHEGIEAICEFYQLGLNAGGKLVLTGAPRCAGNAVAFPFKFAMGSTEIEIIDVFEFNDDGKVVSMKAYWGNDNMNS